jgi:Uma2 family endonuclease
MVITRHKFSSKDYHQMIEIGILGEDDRVELIDGEIVDMAAIGSHHSACTKKSHTFFTQKLGDRVLLGVQDPISLEDGTEPEPDIALLHPANHFYVNQHPTPADVFFILEIADTSFVYDRDVKLLKYAQAGIAEAWLLNLTTQEILACRHPSANGYSHIQTITRGQSLALLAFPNVVVTFDDLFVPATLR